LRRSAPRGLDAAKFSGLIRFDQQEPRPAADEVVLLARHDFRLGRCGRLMPYRSRSSAVIWRITKRPDATCSRTRDSPAPELRELQESLLRR
jgi:hypothetical protein